MERVYSANTRKDYIFFSNESIPFADSSDAVIERRHRHTSPRPYQKNPGLVCSMMHRLQYFFTAL